MSNQNKAVKTFDPRLNTLSRLCVNRIEEVFDRLGVDLTLSGNKYEGNCPIHGESDSGAFNLYYDGYSVPGWWKCRSKGCEDVFQPTMVGFIRGRLSHNELNYHWLKNPKGIYPFQKTIQYICDFLKVKYNSIKVDPKEEERRRFIAECAASINLNQTQHMGIHRTKVKKNLYLPAQYFLDRGFSHDVLLEHDVGMSKNPKLETKDRVIVPIYNAEQYLVGYTCRSVFERCPLCNLFHNPKGNCPTENFEKNLHSKWRNVNFNAASTLYNFWEAKPEIIKTGSVILVEGPADVWKMKEAGLTNVVGLFGNVLHDAQQSLLSSSQCQRIISCLDNDEAGHTGALGIKQRFGRMFTMFFPLVDKSFKDIGELNTDAITNSVKPIIDKILEIYK
jgi:5S rRNA maturation endonuclease (ribonuclease M5)